MAEQRSYTGNFNNRWKFNGKELDEETGLYYYGARFYNPSTSLWLSVDPLVEETMDAYGYCYNNPINLIDPTGMSPEGGEDGIPKNANIVNSLTYNKKNKTHTFTETTYTQTDFKLVKVEPQVNVFSNSYSLNDKVKTYESSKTKTTSVTILNSKGEIVSASSVSETTITTLTKAVSGDFLKPTTESSVDSLPTISKGNQMGPLATVSSNSLKITGTLPIWDDAMYSSNIGSNKMSKHDPAGYKLAQTVTDGLTKTNVYDTVITDLNQRGKGGYNSYRWKTKKEQDSYINLINNY